LQNVQNDGETCFFKKKQEEIQQILNIKRTVVFNTPKI